MAETVAIWTVQMLTKFRELAGRRCARTRYEQAQEREEVTHVDTDWRGRAKSGAWYGAYYQDWNERHPGAWVRGELVPGKLLSGRPVGQLHAELGPGLVCPPRGQDAQRCALHRAGAQHDPADREAQPHRHRGDAAAVSERPMSRCMCGHHPAASCEGANVRRIWPSAVGEVKLIPPKSATGVGAFWFNPSIAH